jgi:hypothetical protein
MNILKLSDDKENLEADIRLLIMDFTNKYPEVDLEMKISKQFETIVNGIVNTRVLTHIDVKLNAKIII